MKKLQFNSLNSLPDFSAKRAPYHIVSLDQPRQSAASD